RALAGKRRRDAQLRPEVRRLVAHRGVIGDHHAPQRAHFFRRAARAPELAGLDVEGIGLVVDREDLPVAERAGRRPRRGWRGRLGARAGRAWPPRRRGRETKSEEPEASFHPKPPDVCERSLAFWPSKHPSGRLLNSMI